MNSATPASDHTQPYKYWAFISYNKNDAKWARWLHRAIETYGIPAQLVSHPTPAGHPAPKRFQPFFRDRDELPASADLGAQVEEALQASRYLIVICSPHAAQSKWVNKEIETFQTFGRQDRVLAMIVEGEPNAGDDRECFPPALRLHEPTAADAREEGDGKNNAKLKLLAGMLGVSFDALKQRDAHRRIRRLQLAVTASLLLVLGLVGLTAYAFYQRNKAVKARQQAEGVLEFMLFELRGPLQAVGRVDVTERVKRRVDEYYKQLGTEAADPRLLLNQAKALENQGHLAYAKGDLESALASYRRGRMIMERLVKSEPENVVYQYGLSSTYYEIGKVMEDNAHWQEALEAHRASLTILQQLASTNVASQDLKQRLGWGYASVGHVLSSQGDVTAALQPLRTSLDIRENLARSDPSNSTWRVEVMQSYEFLGLAFEKEGNWAAAHTNYQDALLAIQVPASVLPPKPVNDWNIAALKRRIADVSQSRGQVIEAITGYRESLETMEQLVRGDPRNARWREDLFQTLHNMAVALRKQGDLLHEEGDLAGALVAHAESLALRQRLAAANSTNASWQWDVVMSLQRMGDVQTERGDLAAAHGNYEQALQLSQKLASTELSDAGSQYNLSLTHGKMGDVLRAQTNMSGALKAYQDSIAIIQRLVEIYPTNTAWQSFLSKQQRKLADALGAQGDLNRALEENRASLRTAEGLAKQNPEDSASQRSLAAEYEKLGDSLTDLKQLADAT
jgi:eukaryotic-like serine/threonine-protein kinase